jgi:uncharacterized protein (TIRG00374 family)
LPGFLRRRISGLDDAGETLEQLWRAPRLAVEFVLLSIAAFLLLQLQAWLVIDAVGSGIGPHEVWVVVVFSAMAGMASGLPFGLGAADVVMVSLLSAYGMDASDAAVAVILMRLLVNLPAGLLGVGGYLLTLRQTSPAAGSAPGAVAPGAAVATGREG